MSDDKWVDGIVELLTPTEELPEEEQALCQNQDCRNRRAGASYSYDCFVLCLTEILLLDDITEIKKRVIEELEYHGEMK